MKDGRVKSKRSDAHAGHAISECRARKSLPFSHAFMRGLESLPIYAIEMRADASTRKFPQFTPKLPDWTASKKSDRGACIGVSGKTRSASIAARCIGFRDLGPGGNR